MALRFLLGRILRVVVVGSMAVLVSATASVAAANCSYDDRPAAARQVGAESPSDPTDVVRWRVAVASDAAHAYDDSCNLAQPNARSSGCRLAPRAAEEFVDLSTAARRNHILHGDATGGGHLYPGLPDKSPFPQTWSGDRILHGISDIATDPAAWRNAIGQGNRTVLTATRGGVDIRVIVDTRTGQIISGYPTNIPRNPR